MISITALVFVHKTQKLQFIRVALFCVYIRHLISCVDNDGDLHEYNSLEKSKRCLMTFSHMIILLMCFMLVCDNFIMLGFLISLSMLIIQYEQIINFGEVGRGYWDLVSENLSTVS